MHYQSEYVWYASYGSNMLMDRFHCYIKGGQPVGSTKMHKGCRNKTLPVDAEEIRIPGELYFARETVSWDNGGVGFLNMNTEPGTHTLGKMYLITREQFVDVVNQENGDAEDIRIDFNKAKSLGSLIVKAGSWYGNIFYLGDQYHYPVFTFTNEMHLQELNKPGENYLRTIIGGLKETYPLNTSGIADYLEGKSGIKDHYTRAELEAIIENVAKHKS